MAPLLDMILKHVPPPSAPLDAPFALGVAMTERDNYLVGTVLAWACMGCLADVACLSSPALGRAVQLWVTAAIHEEPCRLTLGFFHHHPSPLSIACSLCCCTGTGTFCRGASSRAGWPPVPPAWGT